MKCKYCKRESPCKQWIKEKDIIWFTKNGCVNCDIEYFHNQLKSIELMKK